MWMRTAPPSLEELHNTMFIKLWKANIWENSNNFWHYLQATNDAVDIGTNRFSTLTNYMLTTTTRLGVHTFANNNPLAAEQSKLGCIRVKDLKSYAATVKLWWSFLYDLILSLVSRNSELNLNKCRQCQTFSIIW